MPAVEIMSPQSDNVMPTTFWVYGEDDIPRAEKKPAEKAPFSIKVSHRKTNVGGAFTGLKDAELLPNNVWRCELTLSAGEAYDIQAVVYDGGTPTTESDLITNIQVNPGGGNPIIEISEPIRPVALTAGFAPAPRGVFRKNGMVFVDLVRFHLDKKVPDGKQMKKRNRVVGSYMTGLSFGSPWTWHLYDPVKQVPIDRVPRPKGKEKTFVVVATLVDPRDWSVLGTTTQVIDQG
jgi:hypothetical protein